MKKHGNIKEAWYILLRKLYIVSNWQDVQAHELFMPDYWRYCNIDCCLPVFLRKLAS